MGAILMASSTQKECRADRRSRSLLRWRGESFAVAEASARIGLQYKITGRGESHAEITAAGPTG